MAGNQYGRAEPDGEHTTAMADRDLDELLTVEDVATLLRVPKSWVYERTRSRSKPRADCLPSIKLGKYVRFDARAVRSFLLRRSKLA
jgi:predicted DNA-binding transcriptional regulator AlpA